MQMKEKQMIKVSKRYVEVYNEDSRACFQGLGGNNHKVTINFVTVVVHYPFIFDNINAYTQRNNITKCEQRQYDERKNTKAIYTHYLTVD